ncbi:MAG: PLDc N-terminal domain-containing protein, partial [Bacillota bacterium]|nr:PLDc N-terminal domain-containing protein [Bacillota bacterium]
MGRIKNIVLSRILLTAIFASAQLFLIIFLIYYLTTSAIYFYILFQILSFIMLMLLLQRNDNPSFKLMWAVVILILPVFGGVF